MTLVLPAGAPVPGPPRAKPRGVGGFRGRLCGARSAPALLSTAAACAGGEVSTILKKKMYDIFILCDVKCSIYYSINMLF